jgi:hypothetical protein
MQALAESVNNNFLRLTGDTFTGPVTANEGLSKGYRLYNTAGSANARGWSMYLSGSEFRIGKTDDAYGTSTDALRIDRTTTKATFDGPVQYRNYAFRLYRTGEGGTINAHNSNTAGTWNNVAWAAKPMLKEYGEDSTLNLTNCEFTAPVTGYYSFFARACQYGTVATSTYDKNTTHGTKFAITVNGGGGQEMQVFERNFNDRRRCDVTAPAMYIVAGEVVKPSIYHSIANQPLSFEYETATCPEFRGVLISAA